MQLQTEGADLRMLQRASRAARRCPGTKDDQSPPNRTGRCMEIKTHHLGLSIGTAFLGPLYYRSSDFLGSLFHRITIFHSFPVVKPLFLEGLSSIKAAFLEGLLTNSAIFYGASS